MQNLSLVDRLQLLAFLSVVAGLLLVAYEIRQNNILAEAEAVSAMQTGLEALAIAEFQSDIARLRIKSVNEPENLTEEEIVKLDAWLAAWTLQLDRRLEFAERGLTYQSRKHELDLDWNIEFYFDFFIDNKFGRVWYLKAGREFLDPKITEIWDRKIAEGPIDPENNYVKQIMQELDRK